MDRLILNPACVRGRPLRLRLDAAAAAGFDGVGLGLHEIDEAIEHGWTLEGIRDGFAERGLTLDELVVLDDWWRADPPAERFEIERRLFELGMFFDSTYVVAIGHVDGSVAETAERFGSLCDRAVDAGLALALEFTVQRTIGTLAVAREIVERAGRPNGGLVVDIWHILRHPGGREGLEALPGELVVSVQISDAEITGDPADPANYRRVLPGDGQFPLTWYLRTLEAAGVDVPISVEVVSDELDMMPVERSTVLLAERTRAAVAESRAAS